MAPASAKAHPSELVVGVRGYRFSRVKKQGLSVRPIKVRAHMSGRQKKLFLVASLRRFQSFSLTQARPISFPRGDNGVFFDQVNKVFPWHVDSA